MFGRRPNSYQARICVSGFSAIGCGLLVVGFIFLHNLPSDFNIHIFAAFSFSTSLVVIP